MRALLIIGSMALVGITAWSCFSATPPDEAALLEWSDTVDAWDGLCDSAAALLDADSLKLPCLVGPGARRPPQLDSIVAGTGALKVVRVTDYTLTTAHGSLRAAIDSAHAWSDGKTCTVIVFPSGGDVYFDDTNGSQNADGMECVYVVGQTAQGEGINILGGNLRARAMQETYWGYFYQRRPGYRTGFLGSSSATMGSSGFYMEHLSSSWFARSSGHNLATMGCGTESVPMAGVLCRDITFSRNLLFEPHVDHSTFLHTGGDTAEVGGISKIAGVLVHASYMASGGHRTPLFGNTDSMQVIDLVVYNTRNAYAQLGSNRKVQSRIDLLDSYFRPGPYTATGPNRRWAVYVWLLSGTDTTALMAAGLRTEQNDYALHASPPELHRGAQRSTSCLDDVSAYPGWCAEDGDSIPTQIYSRVTDTMRLGPAQAQPMIATLTNTRVEDVIQLAGNSRYLACDGTWTLRSDSVDVRARTEWQNGTGVSASTDLFTDTTRSYGTPSSGTVCADSDADGLPDGWEFEVTGDSTGIAPDSVSNGLPAILWYASGRDPSGALIGCNVCSAERGRSGVR